ncbi:MAG: tRNA lysidine(34) synthetase TilS [Bacteroidota bacterium]
MIEIKKLISVIAPVNSGDGFLIAASGGMDSTVLSSLCHEAGLKIELAHCNFMLRDQESERDEQFVRTLAAKLNVPLHVKKFNTAFFASENKLSIQEAARQLRYNWFQELIASAKHLNWVLTAHHQDDNAETIAMHFFRGTGLKGLMGIPARSGNVLRPLLAVSYNDIQDYATAHHVEFVTDSSNLKEDYTRNYFRHTILPVIEKVYPTVKQNLLDNSKRIEQADQLLQIYVEQFKEKYLLKKQNEYHLSIAQLKKFKQTSLLFELLHPFGFTPGQVGEAALLLNARTGAQLEAATRQWRLIKNRKQLIIAPLLSIKNDYIEVERVDEEVKYPEGSLTFLPAKTSEITFGNEKQVFIDAKHLQFPLLLRKWKEGDYFYPLGMCKKKKVSRLLIDLKFSASEKEKVWVLTTSDKICWVVGIRLDDRFKIARQTNDVIQVRLNSALA